MCKSVLSTMLLSAALVMSGNVAPSEAAKAKKSRNAAVKVYIDISSQSMSVNVNGLRYASWPVSTGKSGNATPRGTWKPTRMSRGHFSRQFKVILPNAIFFTGGIAIHATKKQVHLLGQKASHGCVRLAPGNAAMLYNLVARHGMRSTSITVSH